MKFKIKENVEHDLFCRLGNIIHETVQDAPYTYDDGFYVDQNLNDTTISLILEKSNGFLTIDNEFLFEG